MEGWKEGGSGRETKGGREEGRDRGREGGRELTDAQLAPVGQSLGEHRALDVL